MTVRVKIHLVNFINGLAMVYVKGGYVIIASYRWFGVGAYGLGCKELIQF